MTSIFPPFSGAWNLGFKHLPRVKKLLNIYVDMKVSALTFVLCFPAWKVATLPIPNQTPAFDAVKAPTGWGADYPAGAGRMIRSPVSRNRRWILEYSAPVDTEDAPISEWGKGGVNGVLEVETNGKEEWNCPTCLREPIIGSADVYPGSLRHNKSFCGACLLRRILGIVIVERTEDKQGGVAPDRNVGATWFVRRTEDKKGDKMRVASSVLGPRGVEPGTGNIQVKRMQRANNPPVDTDYVDLGGGKRMERANDLPEDVDLDYIYLGEGRKMRRASKRQAGGLVRRADFTIENRGFITVDSTGDSGEIGGGKKKSVKDGNVDVQTRRKESGWNHKREDGHGMQRLDSEKLTERVKRRTVDPTRDAIVDPNRD